MSLAVTGSEPALTLAGTSASHHGRSRNPGAVKGGSGKASADIGQSWQSPSTPQCANASTDAPNSSTRALITVVLLNACRHS